MSALSWTSLDLFSGSGREASFSPLLRFFKSEKLEIMNASSNLIKSFVLLINCKTTSASPENGDSQRHHRPHSTES
jgi:hypothetical protein